MQTTQSAIKLSLNKTVVTALAKEDMMNYYGKNGNIGFATRTSPPPPPPPTDTESCFTCNSFVPEGCGTGIISW
jgi:hypothetical protein